MLTAALIASVWGATTNGASRQFIGSDLTGMFELFVKQGSCPEKILHKEFSAVRKGMYAVAHSKIEQDGQKCEGEGALGVITKEALDIESGNATAMLTQGLMKPIVDALEKQGTTFLMGYEYETRTCGKSKLGSGTTFVFVEDEKKIDIPGLIQLFPGAKYMIVYTENSPTPCTYAAKQSGRVIGLPEPETKKPLENPVVVTPPEGAAPAIPPKKKPQATKDVTVETAPNRTPRRSPTPKQNPEIADSGSAGSTGSLINEDSQLGDDEFSEMPSESPEDENDGASVCFPGDAEVQLASGLVKRMSSLAIGDRVAVGGGKYSEVFMFTHRDSNIRMTFYELITSTGAKLQLTGSHYLYVNDRSMVARAVRVGDLVELEDGSSTTVVNVRKVTNQGLYNPQTVHGDIIVGGIRASTYTESVHPAAAHSLLVPLRMVFRTLGIASTMLDNGSELLAGIAPKGGMKV